MITKHEIDEAIAELEGERRPNASTCILLAALYALRERNEGTAPRRPSRQSADYGYAYADMAGSKSEFAEAIEGLPVNQVLHLVDEMMQTVKVMQPSLHDVYMRKLRQL